MYTLLMPRPLVVSQVIFDQLNTRQKHNKSSAIWNALVRIYLTNY